MEATKEARTGTATRIARLLYYYTRDYLNTLDEKAQEDAARKEMVEAYSSDGGTRVMICTAESNLKVALSLEYIGWDKIGLIVSAFPAYNKNLEIEAERRERERKAREEGELSKYVGEVGKRVSFKPADYKVLTSWETMYGTTTLYKIVDEAGNVFIWKASAWINAGRPVEKITGTVKEHSEYGGVKQTVLTRCKVEYGKEKHEEWNDENDRAIDAFLKYCDGEEDWEKCCAS